MSVAQRELICREAVKRTTKTGGETLEVRKVLGLLFFFLAAEVKQGDRGDSSFSLTAVRNWTSDSHSA